MQLPKGKVVAHATNVAPLTHPQKTKAKPNIGTPKATIQTNKVSTSTRAPFAHRLSWAAPSAVACLVRTCLAGRCP